MATLNTLLGTPRIEPGPLGEKCKPYLYAMHQHPLWKRQPLPVQSRVGLARSFSLSPEDLLLLDVVVNADAVLDVDDRGEVAVVLVLGVDVQVDNLVLLDDHQEGVVLLDARPVVTEPVAGPALAGEPERAGDLGGQEAELFAAGLLAGVGRQGLKNWVVNLKKVQAQ